MGKKNNLDFKLVEKYCTTANPIFDIIPIKATFTFSQLSEPDIEDLEEFANVEDGRIERWLLIPDCMPLGTLGFAVQRAFGLTPYAFTPSFLLPQNEQSLIFPSLDDALRACGSIFDNPFDEEYFNDLVCSAGESGIFVPNFSQSMMLQPHISYEEAQKRVNDEVSDLRKNGIVLDDGRHSEIFLLAGSPDYLFEKTKDKEFDWSDELCKHIEIKDLLIPEGRPRPDFKKRFVGQRNTATGGRKKGQPFCYSVSMASFFEDEVAFVFTIERPKNIESLIDEGYLSLEEYLDSLHFVSHYLMPDCICKKGYDLFGFNEEAYHSFIMLLHSPVRESVLAEAVKGGWREPTMDLKKIFR